MPGMVDHVANGDVITEAWGDSVADAVDALEAALPSAGTTAALAGTSGTPSGANKFVTDTDARMTNARTPSAHGASHNPGGTDAVTTAAAGASAVGDTASAGTAASLARSDHRHAREAFGSPVASAVADAAADGTATTVARSDHKHAREAFGAPVAVGTANANGAATTVARSDHVHAQAVRKGFEGHGTAVAVATAGTSLPITEDTDTDAFHSGTATTIVIPAGLAGWYSIAASMEYATGGAQRSMELLKGATVLSRSDGNTGVRRVVSWVGKLAVGDSLTLFCTAGGGPINADFQVGLLWMGP